MIKFSTNLEDPKILDVIKERLKSQIVDKLEAVGNKIAMKMRNDSGGKVEPEVIVYEKNRDGKDAVKIFIGKPEEVKVADKLNLVKRSWSVLPTLLKD